MIPFVLVTYFFVQAIFLQDFKALIFLGGLLLAVFIAVISGSLFSVFNKTGKPDNKSICQTVPLFDDGPVSRLPLSTVVLTYALCYFSIPIMHYKRELSNLPILIVFPFLIFFDMMWLYNFGCSSAWNILGAGVVGCATGLFWSEIIFVTNLRQVQYFSILSHSELCSIPSKIKYQCTSTPEMDVARETISAEKAAAIEAAVKVAGEIIVKGSREVLAAEDQAKTAEDKANNARFPENIAFTEYARTAREAANTTVAQMLAKINAALTTSVTKAAKEAGSDATEIVKAIVEAVESTTKDFVDLPKNTNIKDDVKVAVETAATTAFSAVGAVADAKLLSDKKSDIVDKCSELLDKAETKKLQETVMNMSETYPELQGIINNMFLSSTVSNYLITPKRFFSLPGGTSLMNQWNKVQSKDAAQFTQEFTVIYNMDEYTQLLKDTKTYVDANPTAAVETDTSYSKVIRVVSIIEIIQAGLVDGETPTKQTWSKMGL